MIKWFRRLFRKLFGKKKKDVSSASYTPLYTYKNVESTYTYTEEGPVKAITEDDLRGIVSSRYHHYINEDIVRAINMTLLKYRITTPLRAAHFLAQILHESGELRFTEEVWGPTPAQKRYEGRKDLGNTQEGDGYRYRGRGLIQLTGRSNYERYSEYTGIDYVEYPVRVADPPASVDVAGWYWDTHELNIPADLDDILEITRKINGGFNGLNHRTELFHRAKKILL